MNPNHSRHRAQSTRYCCMVFHQTTPTFTDRWIVLSNHFCKWKVWNYPPTSFNFRLLESLALTHSAIDGFSPPEWYRTFVRQGILSPIKLQLRVRRLFTWQHVRHTFTAYFTHDGSPYLLHFSGLFSEFFSQRTDHGLWRITDSKYQRYRPFTVLEGRPLALCSGFSPPERLLKGCMGLSSSVLWLYHIQTDLSRGNFHQLTFDNQGMVVP